MPSDGLKKLTPANWLEPDPASLVRSRLRMPGVDIATPPWPERLEIVLRSRLSESVPSDIAALFESAQGAIAYGYFYYPLYTLGTDHLYRAFEAAVATRAKREGYGEDRAGLAKTLRWLTEKGVLTETVAAALKPLRDLRNEASHPGFQGIITPGMAIAMLDDVARQINNLLAASAGSGAG